jgi:hypothetical protein
METPLRTTASSRRKPKADLYTALLAMALVALLVAILFLYLFMGKYDFKMKGAPMVGTLDARQSVAFDQHWPMDQLLKV